MAYSPHTWQCDETITDEKMNNMEQGIAAANNKVQYVHLTQETPGSSYTADMTFDEIVAAYQEGDAIFAVWEYGDAENVYALSFINPSSVVFTRTRANLFESTTTLLHGEVTISASNIVTMNEYNVDTAS